MAKRSHSGLNIPWFVWYNANAGTNNSSDVALIQAHFVQADQKLQQIITLIHEQYLQSPLPNSRKGGLIAMASCALALAGA